MKKRTIAATKKPSVTSRTAKVAAQTPAPAPKKAAGVKVHPTTEQLTAMFSNVNVDRVS